MSFVDVDRFVKAREGTLGRHVLQHRCQYEIPLNQRPWVWTARNLEDLWRDFETALNAFFEYSAPDGEWRERLQPIGYPHFIGTFLLVKKQDDLYEVFDGQQRLTAITMLFACIREIAQ